MASGNPYITDPQITGAGPPNLVAPIYAMIAGIPKAYNEGAKAAYERGQYRRIEELQKPFDAPDFATGMQQYLHLMGAEGFEKMAPTQFKLDYLRQQPPTAPSPYSAGDINAPADSETGATTPARSLPGADKAGQPAHMLAPDRRGPFNLRQAAIDADVDFNAPQFKEVFGDRNLDAPIDPRWRPATENAMRNYAAAALPQQGRQPSSVGVAADAGGGPAMGNPPPASYFQGGATSGAQPVPTQIMRPPGMAGPAAMPSGAPGLVPPEWRGREQEFAYGLKRRAEAMRKQAADRDVVGFKAEALEAQAAGYDKTADQILGAIRQAGEPTGTQKEAGGIPVPEFERSKALSAEMGKKQAAVIGEYIDAGRSAQKRIQALDTIEDALRRGGGNITTGPFAEHVLHAKQAISSAFGINLAGVPEAEVAQKTGFALASQAVKEITNRPTQREFVAAIQNNPGLLLSKKGSFLMADVMKQSARQDIELTKLAMRRENWDNWADVVDRFYRDNPLKSPFDHSKNLGMEDLAAIGGRAVPAAAVGGAGARLPPGWSVREH